MSSPTMMSDDLRGMEVAHLHGLWGLAQIFFACAPPLTSSVEGIQDAGTSPGDVARIASHERQIVNQGRRGQQSVDGRQRIGNVEPAPKLRHRLIDGQDAALVAVGEAAEPMIEALGRGAVPGSEALDTLPKLSENEDRQAKLVVVGFVEPAHDAPIGAGSLADLGDDVRIDEKAHNRTRLARGLRSSKSPSSPSSGIARRCALRLRRGAGNSWRRRISRCSASAERPFLTASRLSASMMASSTFRTSS